MKVVASLVLSSVFICCVQGFLPTSKGKVLDVRRGEIYDPEYVLGYEPYESRDVWNKLKHASKAVRRKGRKYDGREPYHRQVDGYRPVVVRSPALDLDFDDDGGYGDEVFVVPGLGKTLPVYGRVGQSMEAAEASQGAEQFEAGAEEAEVVAPGFGEAEEPEEAEEGLELSAHDVESVDDHLGGANDQLQGANDYLEAAEDFLEAVAQNADDGIDVADDDIFNLVGGHGTDGAHDHDAEVADESIDGAVDDLEGVDDDHEEEAEEFEGMESDFEDAEVAEPEVAEPEAEVAEPEAVVAEPEAEVAEPEAEVAEPEAEEPEISAEEPTRDVVEKLRKLVDIEADPVKAVESYTEFRTALDELGVPRDSESVNRALQRIDRARRLGEPADAVDLNVARAVEAIFLELLEE